MSDETREALIPPHMPGMVAWCCIDDHTWLTRSRDGDGMPPALHDGDDECPICGQDGAWEPDQTSAWTEVDL